MRGCMVGGAVALLSLATASPPHVLAQDDVAEAARRLFQDRFPQFDRMAGVFKTAGVRTRQSVRPIEWYLEPRGWPERTAAFDQASAASTFTSRIFCIARSSMSKMEPYAGLVPALLTKKSS